MSFEEIGSWIAQNRIVNGEDIFDDDFSGIEDQYEAGEEAEAFNEYEAIANEIWDAMQAAQQA